MKRLHGVLQQIYRAALEAVDPQQAVSRFLERERLPSGDFSKIHVLAIGKAALPMAQAVATHLKGRLAGGIVITKEGYGGFLNGFEVLEAGHPEPDERSEAAALQALHYLETRLTCQDLLMVLVSGGGSALLCAPVESISFADKIETSSALIRCGASIQEINAVRKHLSRVKGGRLLKFTQDATVISLLLSDVVGDDFSSIASGPTVADPTCYQDCLRVLKRYQLEPALPPRVVDFLKTGAAGQVPETLKSTDSLLKRVTNHLVGGNLQALEAAARQSEELGYRPLILSSSIAGNTPDVALVHMAIAREILSSRNPVSPPCCLISGGETTVQVTGTGTGGRNMEFVLECARAIDGWPHLNLLVASLGSDGSDGPTNAAGAMATPQTAHKARQLGLDLERYLDNNDSYHFFQALGDLIHTGPTRTNVMDLRFVLIS